MKKTWVWIVEYRKLVTDAFEANAAKKCEQFLKDHPEWDTDIKPDPLEEGIPNVPMEWYSRHLVRWSTIPERYCGKYARGPRDAPMSPKHFSEAQEILIHLVYKEDLVSGWDQHGKVLGPDKYLTRLRNTKTKETIPGEIYTL